MPETQQKKSFVIDRAKWRFGGRIFENTFGFTRLYTSEHDVMCCLGFVMEQLGADKAEFDGCSTPEKFCDIEFGIASENVTDKLKGILIEDVGFLDYEHTKLTKSAIDINDHEDSLFPLEQSLREKKLIDLFAEHGFTLEFTGEYTETQKQVMTENRILY